MTAGETLLLVDDQVDMRASIAQWFGLAGVAVIETGSGHQAMEHIKPDFPGVLLSDVKMPGMDGLDLLRQCQSIDPDIPVVLMTGHGDVPMAVEAMRLGAYDFLEKPFEPQSLIDVVKRAQEKRALVLSNRTLRARLSDSSDIDRRLIGNSPAMQRLKEDILDFSQTDASVLIMGETGTGKELVARSLHDFGARTAGPFVAINCPAVPETMFEAELFGHAAGAYTGAAKAREGWIEAADKGILFLDELSSLPLHLQPKLLRVLQEKEISRLGSSSLRSVDFRAIAATNADLAEAAEDNRFREDLLYRLNTIELHVPPLRERGQDVVLLFETFCQRFAELDGLEPCRLTSDDLACLMTYDWPGNVRQLRNVAERFTLRGQKRAIAVADVMSKPESVVPSSAPLKTLVETYESELIRQALKRNNGNMADAMMELDVPRRTLNEKMARYGIERSDYL